MNNDDFEKKLAAFRPREHRDIRPAILSCIPVANAKPASKWFGLNPYWITTGCGFLLGLVSMYFAMHGFEMVKSKRNPNREPPKERKIYLFDDDLYAGDNRPWGRKLISRTVREEQIPEPEKECTYSNLLRQSRWGMEP